MNIQQVASRKSGNAVLRKIKLKNSFTGEIVEGELVIEEEIEGKKFFVVQIGPRTMKFARDGYSIVRTR